MLTALAVLAVLVCLSACLSVCFFVVRVSGGRLRAERWLSKERGEGFTMRGEARREATVCKPACAASKAKGKSQEKREWQKVRVRRGGKVWDAEPEGTTTGGCAVDALR